MEADRRVARRGTREGTRSRVCFCHTQHSLWPLGTSLGPWVALLGPGGSLPQRDGVRLPVHVRHSLRVRGLLESVD